MDGELADDAQRLDLLEFRHRGRIVLDAGGLGAAEDVGEVGGAVAICASTNRLLVNTRQDLAPPAFSRGARIREGGKTRTHA